MKKIDIDLDPIRIHSGGVEWIGYRVIEGSNKLDQHIVIAGQYEPDLKGYAKADKDKSMRAYAELIAKQLLSNDRPATARRLPERVLSALESAGLLGRVGL